MKRWKPLLGTMRLPFVILAPACVLVGLGTAYRETGQINWLYFLLALLGAVASHISVNAFNEYFDFKTELDSRTQKTPFSGGSGTLKCLRSSHVSAPLVLPESSLMARSCRYAAVSTR